MNIYFRLSGFHSSLLLIHFRYGPNTYLFTLHQSVAQNPSVMRVTVDDSPFSRWAWRSFASLQKSRRNHRSCVWTEALSGMGGFRADAKAIRYSVNVSRNGLLYEHRLRLHSRKASHWFDLHPCLHSCIGIMTGRTILCADSTSPGTLRNHDGDGNENARKATGLMSKTTTLHVQHAFLYISLPSLHNYDVKWQNFKFTWEPRTARR